MSLLIKLLHIVALTIWVAGLLYLPRMFALRLRADGREEREEFSRLEHRLYFEVMTPAAVLAVVFGSVLLLWGFEGGWLPLKLTFVVLLVLVHIYCGRVVLLHAKHKTTRGPLFFLLLNLIPVPLAVIIVALAAAKPL